MADVKITNNTGAFEQAANEAVARALEIIGGKIESYAKTRITELGAVDTGALRNSITHQVDGDTVVAGSAIFYAPYIELGTGKEYQPPPEWMENNAERGAGIRKGGIKPRPYLRPAIEEHLEEYKHIIENELKNA